MTVHELNRDQMIQLKQAIYCQKKKSVSWGELASVDTLVSDKKVIKEYGSTEFTEEDFY